MTLNMYEEYERQAREAAHLNYISAPEFQSLEVEADARGYRKATITEINCSVGSRGPYAPDLYCWRGGLWVKK